MNEICSEKSLNDTQNKPEMKNRKKKHIFQVYCIYSSKFHVIACSHLHLHIF